MDSQIFELEWDTNYFGVQSAKLILKNQIELIELYNILPKLNEFEFITIVNAESNSYNNYLIGEFTTSFLVDVNVQFQKSVKKREINSYYRSINNYDFDFKLLEIAKKEFTFSRFYNDPYLNENLSKEIYLNWVKNSFNQEEKYFIVANDSNTTHGYILFSISNQSEIIIELISIASESQSIGIGTKLIDSLESFAISEGIKKIIVGTQIDNIQAVNFYMKKGFSFINKSSIYHYWPKMESDKNDC